MIPMRPVLAISKKDGSIVKRYRSSAEAARENGVRQSEIYHTCKHHRTNRGRVFYRFEDDWDGFAEFKSNRPVIVLDMKTKRLAWFPSRLDAAEAMNYNPGTMLKAMQQKRAIERRYMVFYQRNTEMWKRLTNA